MPGYGINIRLEDLAQGKNFYRDILKLGDPVMESSFWVEFELENGFTLMLSSLEPGEELPPESGRFSWILFTDDPETLIKRLQSFGYEPERSFSQGGYEVLDFRDPEGNPFSVYAPVERENNQPAE